MASASDCLKAIDAAAKGELSDAEIEDLIESLDRIRQARGLDDVEKAIFDEAGRIAEDVELAAQIEKRNRLINIVTEGRAMTLARTARKNLGDASLGLEAAMVGINSKLEGGRLSADARGKALFVSYLGAMIADLRKDDLLGLYTRGDIDRDIAREIADLSQAKPTGRATANADAKKIAAAVHKVQRAAVQRENRAGAHIRLLEGRIARTTHDRARMERTGFDAWSQDVNRRLDWGTMKINQADRPEFLNSVYEALVTGVRKDAPGGAENDVLFAFKGPGNLARKESASRVLQWKSADDWFDYNEKFGSRNLREAISADFRRSAQNTALMNALGTNPRAMFEKLRDNLKKEFRSDPKQVNRLARPQLDWFMAEIDGTVNFSNNHTLATVGHVFRGVQTMAKLGGAVISQVADIAATASERRFQGRSLMDSWADGFLSTVDGFTTGDLREYSDLLGVGLDGFNGDIAARMSAQDDVPGKMSRALSIFFKLNLQGPVTDATKRGVGLMMARDLASQAAKPLSALPPGVRRNLAQYGIDARIWEVARLAVKEGPDGRTYMLPGEIETVRGAPFTGLTKPQQRRIRDQAKEAISTYLTDRVEFASPTPGARERAFLRFGMQRGTPLGEAVRTMMQFKAFPTTVLSRVVGRDLFAGGARNLSDAFLKGEADLVGLANFIAGGTVLGYFALQAKEMAKGRQPREASPELFVASMIQGGGLGIYGDFLLGQTNRFGRSMLETAAGPGFGVIAELDQLNKSFIAGQDVGGTLVRIMRSNLPGANMFYARAAMDYLIFYQLQEMANPGYLRRMERRIKRDNNQQFFLPPSRVIPRSGGPRIFEGVRS